MTADALSDWVVRPGPVSVLRGLVSLRTLVFVRWVAIAGQLVALLFVHWGLGFGLPILSCLCVVAVAALFNLSNSLQRPAALRLSERDAMVFLAFDIIEMAALLYLTGGLENPFSILLLAPVTIGASILSRGPSAALLILSLVAIVILAIQRLPLPWYPEGLGFPALYIAGDAFALALAALFIGGYVWSVTQEGRRMSNGLAAVERALAQEQRISAVGALAAAAAHELGSPLATIAVVARELAHDLPPESPHHEDAQLLLQESARCRTILAELSERHDTDSGSPFAQLPAAVLVEFVGDSHVREGAEIVYETDGPPLDQPSVARSPAVIHGLGNLIRNAAQFATTRVEVTTSWDAESLMVEVVDDGPGYPPQILGRLGEPYLSGRDDRTGHMGLGIFVARTLLQGTGATLYFANAPAGGAIARVRWLRRYLRALDVTAEETGS